MLFVRGKGMFGYDWEEMFKGRVEEYGNNSYRILKLRIVIII